MSHFYLGIDVSKAKLDCALRLPSGKFRAKVIPNSLEGFTTLLTWLNTQKAESMHVCMEATGIYWEDVAQHLAIAGLPSASSIRHKSKPMVLHGSPAAKPTPSTPNSSPISVPSANHLLGSPVARRKSRYVLWCYAWTPYKPCALRKATACWWHGKPCARTFSNI